MKTLCTARIFQPTRHGKLMNNYLPTVHKIMLISSKNYGIISFNATITEIDPVYDNEYKVSYSQMTEHDRQLLLYYMYIYSNNIDQEVI